MAGLINKVSQKEALIAEKKQQQEAWLNGSETHATLFIHCATGKRR